MKGASNQVLRTSVLLLALIMNSTFMAVAGQVHEEIGDLRLLSPMDGPRYNQSAVLLRDGWVLSCGGTFDGYGSLRSAELLDPATGEWSRTSDLLEARMRQTATLLPDGRVLVAGGFVGGGHPSLFKHYKGPGNFSLSSCELYDPVQGTFSPTTSLLQGRFWHAALMLKDGRVLVIGGLNVTEGALATCELFDPVLGVWAEAAPMSTPRARFAYGLLEDGRVVVAGGHDGTAKVSFPDCEVYDPALNGWSTISPLGEARGYPGFTMLDTGELLVCGGFSTPTTPDLASSELLDPQTLTWKKGPDMNYGRHGHIVVPCGRSEVLVMGGSDWDTGACLSSVELLSSDHRAWLETFLVTEGRLWGQGVPDGRGNALMIGGKACTVASGRTDIYFPEVSKGQVKGPNAPVWAISLGASLLIGLVVLRVALDRWDRRVN